MQTILILTVAGSHAPIVKSIEQNHPDFIHFLCSDDTETGKGSYTQIIGEGKVIKSNLSLDKPDLPNIATQTNLSTDRFKVHTIQHLDNLSDCYLTAADLIVRLHSEYPDATIIADYTGGTKSMTAGLAAAALDDGRCEIKMVTGLRQDMERVTDRTEFVRPLQVWDVQVRRRMKLAADLIARFDYAGAARLLEETANRFASDSTIGKLQQWLALCRAFDAWDRFDHEAARQLLRPYKKSVDSHVKFLGVMLDRHGHGFELVEDLLLNAERRAAQGRYDDAVGRLYRALELCAQIWLREKHELNTSQVDLALVPAGISERVEKNRDEKGVIKIALRLAWEVIAAFPDDPLGEHFAADEKRLLGFLEVRNQSLLAHGLRPVSREDYQKHAAFVTSFLIEAIEQALKTLSKQRIVSLPQFPTGFDV